MKILLFFLGIFYEGLKGFAMAALLISGIALALGLAFGPAMLAIELYEAGHLFYGSIVGIIGVMIYGAGFKYT